MTQHIAAPSRSGFTIVEVLVVITVIGILATIVLFTYKGAQQKAYNTQITQGVAQYLKAIETYKGLNGRYPRVSSETGVADSVHLTCLGRGYPGASCGTVTGVVVVEDGAFNAAIAEVLGDDAPRIGENVISVTGETFIGAVYGIDLIDGTKHDGLSHARIINYALLGEDADCAVTGAYSYRTSATEPATTACEIFINDQ